ncbi:hypothetical protein AB4Z13_15955 [Rhizobium sp. YAF28]|uniref:hypothetical protein n=1 Tax=Rhizobium sp. YAF28 TaxID=3233081 RepID=UPI003F9EB993
MPFYTDGTVPWNSLNDNTRAPLASELESGYPCGPADQELFNWTAGWPIGNIWNILLSAGIVPDTDKLFDLARAIRSQRMNYFVPGGTTSAMTITPSPAFATLSDLVGVPIRIKNGASANPGTLTVNPNGLGNVPVHQIDNSDLVAGVIPANAIFEIVYNGTVFLLLSGGAQQSTISQRLQNFVLIADQKAAGVAGGSFTSGAWRTRDLNTVVADPQAMVSGGLVSLSANRITLSAGKWNIEASAPALGVDGHKARLYNVTDSAVAAYGTTENATANGTSDQVQTRASLVATLTLAASKQFELQHVCITTMASIGFGIASDYGLGANNGLETYAIIRAQKLD